ncbi:MAG TPA: GNAT family acetyltransferase [Actinomycetales bacterium]|nr:GNAT family acetyltransferase [Actinomycetales bacterium]
MPEQQIVPDSSDVAIREASDSDLERVIALWKACELTRPWNDPHKDAIAALSGENSTILVGESREQIIATVMAGGDGHRGWLYYLAVDPAHQRRGHGRAMVIAAEEWLAGIGIEKVQLMVRAGNEHAMDFYGALGYADQNVAVLGRWLAT